MRCKAAEQGHAKSMNLVGRYHEEGLVVARDLAQAAHWYRRSAEGGDFRGQFSHAAMLSASGRHAEAETWLRRALEGGNLNFLRSARGLEQSAHPPFRSLALAYYRRAAQLGDDTDREALEQARSNVTGTHDCPSDEQRPTLCSHPHNTF